MYLKGIKDYDRQGKARETGVFAGPVSRDGELRRSQNGKTYGQISVRAFGRQDGTAAFMTLKSFSDADARRIAALHKGDRIFAAGVVDSRDYNGKTYTDMLVDLLLVPNDTAANLADLERRMDSAGFDTGGDPIPLNEEDTDEGLPF